MRPHRGRRDIRYGLGGRWVAEREWGDPINATHREQGLENIEKTGGAHFSETRASFC
jgi:hypothetical protein